MNAIVPTCDYYGQYGSCPCSDECEHYISEQEVENIIRKRVEAVHSHEDGQWFDLTDALTVERNDWIPCSERLPEEGEKVLASTTNTVFTQVFNGTHGTSDSWWWNNNAIKTIYAWMPLPKPYREDGEA